MLRKALFVSVSAMAMMSLAGVANAQEQAAPAAPPQSEASGTEDPEIIVTGVFSATSIERAPISITAVTEDALRRQAPISSADALKSVPGVFVNSSLGEIRNIVFSRGVSARSLEAAGGYFYISLQEDGLPVEPVTATNFGPDYFSRLDLMNNRIEALRGGTAVVTGANAPGGIFNYISKTGKSAPGTQFQFKLGLEGDGKSPLYRFDGYTGGQIADSDLYYAIGGFYRVSDGARYPGYKLNKGGQIRGNLLWDYGEGSLTVRAKYLSDHNGWFETLPARDFKDPKILAPYTNLSSVLPPASPHSYPDFGTGELRDWDGSKLVKSTAVAFDVNWRHDLTDNIQISNSFRFSRNKAHWNTVAVNFATPLTDADAGIRTIQGTNGIDGTYTYRLPDGSVAAVVSQVGATRTLVVNNLPNQNILAGGIMAGLAYQPDFRSQTFQDQLTISGTFGRHRLSLGAYFDQSTFHQRFSGAGGGVMTLTPRPVLLSTTLTRPDGSVYLVTDSSGWAGIGQGLAIRESGTKMTDIAVYGGDTWEVTDKLTIDVGGRYESLNYDSYTYLPVAFTGNKLTTGGRDGNPLTLYDNATTARGAKLPFKRKYDYFAFSGSAAYQFSDAFQAYVRYTSGKKAPDFGILSGITTAASIATIFPSAEKIQQIEMGLKYRDNGMFIQAFPFWSKNSNIADNQTFTYKPGTPNAGTGYSPPPAFGEVETFGIEISGDFDVTDKLNLHADLTLQDPKASGFSTYTQGPKGDGTDDIVSTVPAGTADNNPKVIARATATYRPVEAVSLFATYSYLGKRAANRRNAWYLPAFSTVDVGVAWDVSSNFSVQGNVTNLFNTVGIMGWAKGGSLLTALDRQTLTPAQVEADPNQLFSVLPNQPRAFYLTLSMKL